MPLLFLNDAKLYEDYEYYQANFRWLLQGNPGQTILYHCYWQGSFSFLHEMCLKSLLITQSEPYEIWIWQSSHGRASNQAFESLFKDHRQVKFKEYNPEDEHRGTPYESHREMLSGSPVRMSDALRLLFLAKFGGVYFDLDVLFLKDLRELCMLEFTYQWSTQPFANNALLHFKKGSANVWALMERSIKIQSCHSAKLFRFPELVDLPGETYVFPTFFFDPAWISHDTGVRNPYCNHFRDFFGPAEPIRVTQFFPRSYAYHWHNQWEKTVAFNTLAGHLFADIQRMYSCNRLT